MHDVFISHAHKDKNIAGAICQKLESAKLRCWVRPRDVSASDDRSEATRKAIGTSRVVVLVLSDNANAAPHIEREIAHAFYSRRTIIPFRLSNTVPRRSFLFYLDNASWFDASGPDAEQHLEALALRITDLVLTRSVAGNHNLPQGPIKTATPLEFRGSSIGALQTSHYRTLNILISYNFGVRAQRAVNVGPQSGQRAFDQIVHAALCLGHGGGLVNAERFSNRSIVCLLVRLNVSGITGR
jgi:hypothetical protein